MYDLYSRMRIMLVACKVDDSLLSKNNETNDIYYNAIYAVQSLELCPKTPQLCESKLKGNTCL